MNTPNVQKAIDQLYLFGERSCGAILCVALKEDSTYAQVGMAINSLKKIITRANTKKEFYKDLINTLTNAHVELQYLLSLKNKPSKGEIVKHQFSLDYCAER